MYLTHEFESIRIWAEDKGIYQKGDLKTQYIKLCEESGELARAILKDDNDEFIDAIGDCVVVLTNLAKLKGYKIEDCINSAYKVINKRTGKMENGTFVKDGI
jgi:NTP pyrophosphatase (non-canonical NTP hydrolase)